MTTNESDDNQNLDCDVFVAMKGNEMSVRTRKTATVEIELPTVEDVIENTDDVTAVDAPPARKYFSHANCEHATKGDAGKVARAACRKAMKAKALELAEAV